ncbi:MBL fold metallo-hydrolase RNA specificity domain-containing protein [Methylibium petroleiphilum]|uniref:MBL fold metallo-hydrolase RNA specificity domain-containing protein n=1 Tax=Methylibium petroleiphilum TaxID=105560 RepID=UPI001AC67A22|nr:MBL fold metallo-hydrolase [Methylibium petroleiphilum]MBN9203716.1 MBL fold metallo-hydrolase [Methylibium petroleiphilum]
MQITFLGAADTVTGSRHLVSIDGQRILLDCGLFQGYKVLRERNWASFPVPPAEIDAVVLSHAHLDHCGYLPSLVKQGFRGAIYASPATCDLCEVLLLDSAKLQEEDARRANRYHYSSHEKALPLYTTAEAKRALSRMTPIPAGRQVRIGKVEIVLTPVGHLLGACAVTLRSAEGTLVYSGDLGRHDDHLMPPPETVAHGDVILIESTYGDRNHPPDDADPRLAEIIRATVGRGGSVLLPSFAVGRAQALLHSLQKLRSAGEIAREMPIFLDSPMAIEATALYQRHRRLLRLTARETAALTDGVTLVTTPQQSQRLSRHHYPCVIISASGMATGGRVLHHLKAMAPNPRHHVVFPGFQVPGTRGGKLVGGAKEVKIHGEYVAVNADVSQIEGFSGHADADGLMAWLRGFDSKPRQAFVVHGDPAAADTLRMRIKDELGWPVHVPEHLASYAA